MKRSLVLVLLFTCSLFVAGQDGGAAPGPGAFGAAAQGPPKPGVLKGVVTNGTKNRPSAGDDVILLKLAGGMEEEARTKTNAKGEFSLQVGDLNQPHVVRVRHQSVNYHQPAMPGSDSIRIQVYDAAPQVKGINIQEHSYILQAQAGTAQIYEIFSVQNTSNPPVTLANEHPFEFYIPDGAKLDAGEVTPPGGMTTNNAPVPEKEKGKYTFLYPIHPGETRFEISYQLPYSGQLKIEPKLAANTSRLFVVTPKAMSFSSVDGSTYESAPQPQDDPQTKFVDVHGLRDAAPGQLLAFQISGEGVIPNSTDQSGQASGAGADNRPGGGLGVPNSKPDPLHSGQYLFLGVLLLFLAGGGFYVYATHHPGSALVPAAAPAGGAAPAPKPRDRSALLLDVMKEELFQLESERLQGRISPQEYSAAKSALDKTLERAMKRQKAGS